VRRHFCATCLQPVAGTHIIETRHERIHVLAWCHHFKDTRWIDSTISGDVWWFDTDAPGERFETRREARERELRESLAAYRASKGPSE
jgi:hypothetical protein